MLRAAGTARKETDQAAHARDSGDAMSANDVKWSEREMRDQRMKQSFDPVKGNSQPMLPRVSGRPT